jgi:hypothetical protein
VAANGNGSALSNAEKRKLAQRMRSKGATFAQISGTLGISPQAARRACDPTIIARQGARARASQARAKASTAAVRRDLEEQIACDRSRDARQSVLAVRWEACEQAGGALHADEPDARLALRGALIDLSAVALLLAEELPLDQGFAEATEGTEPVAA